MKLLIVFAASLILSFENQNILFAQDSVKTTIAILPFQYNGIDPVSIQTAESILRLEINKLSKLKIIPESTIKDKISKIDFTDNEQIIAAGKLIDANETLTCNLAALGEKIIVQYSLLNVLTGSKLLVDQITAMNMEDLEVVMKRVAKSVVEHESSKKVAEVGNIGESESIEPLRRSSTKNFGISFGYLYPQNGYDNGDRALTFDARFDYELEEYAVGTLIGIRKGFGTYLYGSYLFSKSDFCPYIGGGLGFHWVSHNGYNNGNNRGDGFEFSAHTGLRIFRTYNFQILINLEYNITINDFKDNAIIFTIGIL